ncbi:MAG: choice-of-anchor D domain-containing protein [Verrucomicrobiaceae bacterium]|nr:choice-of-anchor D domain-containing protein [Verrucomicrobiaceae bacterium]
MATPRDGGWTWGLELKSYGRGTRQAQVSGKPTVKAEGQRLSYQWDADVQEWWVNDPRGLEHGYVIHSRPEGDPAEELTFLLGTRGSLRPKVSADAKGVEFCDAAGTTVLNYTGLKVWDADGKVLTSRFEAAGEKSVRLLVEERGARYPLTIDPIAQQAYLKPAAVGSTQAGDRFGYSVAVAGDTVVVGAWGEDSSTMGVQAGAGTPNENAADAGAAYIFVRSAGVWTQQAYLKPAAVGTTQAFDKFGYSVAVAGDTVVVGAWGEDSSTTGVNSTHDESAGGAGAAYIFVRSAGVWTQQAYLKPAAVGTTQAGDLFGSSVAVAGDTVVVGAWGEDSSTTGVQAGAGTANESAANAGAAYIFVRSAGVWTQQAYLKPAAVGTTQAVDQFGRSVAVVGDTVVVGASGEDSSTLGVQAGAGTPNESAGSSGAAYVFVRSAGVWTQQAYLKPAAVGTTQVNDNFGSSVAVAGDTVVVGAPTEYSSTTGAQAGAGTPNESASAAGAAYVFVRSAGVWTQQAYLKPAAVGTTQAGDQFGTSVAVAGDTVVVGANREDSSIMGVQAGAGTPNESASAAGAAYVFVRSAGVWTQQAYLKPAAVGTTQADDNFGSAVAVAGDTVVVGAIEEDSSTTGAQAGAGTPNDILGAISDSGAAYIFTGFAPMPEIAVEQPLNTNIADGGSKSFGTVVVGANTSLTFTIKNVGTTNLIGLAITKDGADASQFTVTSFPAATVSGPSGSTTFTVKFAPTSAGTKTAALHIANNDSDENPFDITLTGSGYYPGLPTAGLLITGPTICAADSSVQFQAWAQSGASSVDVTSLATWSATGAALSYDGLGKVVVYGNRLTAGAFVPNGEKILVTASYTGSSGRITSAPHEVVTGDGNTLGVTLVNVKGLYQRPEAGGYVWRVNASSSVAAATGVTYQWYLDDVLQTGSASSFDKEVPGRGGSVKLKLVVTDSLNRTGTVTRLVTLQVPALNEPGQKYPASQPAGATFVNSQGQLFQFDATRIPHGLIVLTHGLTDNPNAPWIRELANAIASRLHDEGKPVPNIVIFGWEYGANPFLKDLGSTDTSLVAQALKTNATILAGLPGVGEFIYNLKAIKPDAKGYGITLANWVKAESAPGVDHIDVTKPIHFIGHSAGGFVTSDAANLLKRWNVATVSQVTMLDTPIPDRAVFTSLMNPTVMERYVSTLAGAAAPDLGELPAILSSRLALLIDPNAITQTSNSLPQGTYYRRYVLSNFYSDPIAGANVFSVAAHNYSREWYINSAYGVTAEGGGFALSPFMTVQAPAPANQAFAMMSEAADTPLTSAALDGFSTFGSVTGSGSPYIVTEDTNAGIQQTLTLPVGADALQFRYQFTTAGDGDFIAVYFGDNPPLFIGPDVVAARTAPLEVNVPLQGYEGQTGTLVIKLVSQGLTNAVAQIDQITLSTTDDPDHDGMTITQEQTLGTDFLLYDTDSDGIGDWEEVNTTLTNPLLADSDADGMSDAQEIIAGTGGMDAASVFRATGTARDINGAMTVTWAAKVRKTYRVQRSDTPAFINYTVVGSSISGVEPTTSFTDSTVPGDIPRAFYRVEVE